MRFIKGFLAAVISSVIVNLIILFVVGPHVINPALPLHALTVFPVAGLTIIGAIGATIVYALMRAFLTKPNKPFIWLSVVVLIISFIPDYLIIGDTTGFFSGGTWPTALTLMLMHTAAAILIVASLVKFWGARTQASI